jgi:hypothetical protein
MKNATALFIERVASDQDEPTDASQPGNTHTSLIIDVILSLTIRQVSKEFQTQSRKETPPKAKAPKKLFQTKLLGFVGLKVTDTAPTDTTSTKPRETATEATKKGGKKMKKRVGRKEEGIGYGECRFHWLSNLHHDHEFPVGYKQVFGISRSQVSQVTYKVYLVFHTCSTFTHP